MNKLIIVTGTGRCGTSAVGRMLNAAGLPTGPDFAADDTNPHGFFEDSRVVAYHERVKAGDTSRLMEYRGYLAGRVASSDAVVKDPRFCDPGVWDTVEPHLPDPRFVILCERNIEETVDSLVRAYGMARGQALQLAIARRNAGRRLAEKEAHHVVQFHTLITDTASVVDQLCGFLGLSGRRTAMGCAVDPNLWRCRAENA